MHPEMIMKQGMSTSDSLPLVSSPCFSSYIFYYFSKVMQIIRCSYQYARDLTPRALLHPLGPRVFTDTERNVVSEVLTSGLMVFLFTLRIIFPLLSPRFLSLLMPPY
jgi:hypothetical protein